MRHDVINRVALAAIRFALPQRAVSLWSGSAFTIDIDKLNGYEQQYRNLFEQSSKFFAEQQKPARKFKALRGDGLYLFALDEADLRNSIDIAKAAIKALRTVASEAPPIGAREWLEIVDRNDDASVLKQRLNEVADGVPIRFLWFRANFAADSTITEALVQFLREHDVVAVDLHSSVGVTIQVLEQLYELEHLRVIYIAAVKSQPDCEMLRRKVTARVDEQVPRLADGSVDREALTAEVLYESLSSSAFAARDVA
jgi:hypothetical protein